MPDTQTTAAAARAALLKTGALQNAILTSANFSIIATDEKGIIQLFNVGAERMLGYLAAEVVDRINPSDIHDLEEVRERAETLSRELGTTIAPGFEALAFKASRDIEDIYELTYICKDGSRFPAIVSITALRDDYGVIIGYLLIGTDNSVRKRVESELNEAMAAADRANRAKSDFLSSMSHELRTPLNAILGFAQLLETGAPAPTVTQRRNIDQILKAGWYLLELINEILDLALIESGKLTLSNEPVSLVEVLIECRAMIEPQARQRGIGMTFPSFRRSAVHQCGPHPRQAGADQPAVQRHQVQPAAGRGGRQVRAGAARLDPHQRARHRRRPDGRTARAAVSAVQPAGQGGRSRGGHRHRPGGDQAAGGTDGRRDRRRERGRDRQRVLGRLPGGSGAAASRAAGAATVVEQPRRRPTARRCARVLYVEDNPANLELVAQLIARRQDLRLLTATDGQLGVEYARACLPDVILMDINLPGLSGTAAMKLLRADPATAHIPVIALSANAVPRDIQRGLEAGFFNYVTKPIVVGHFMDALDLALAHCATTAQQAAATEQPA